MQGFTVMTTTPATVKGTLHGSFHSVSIYLKGQWTFVTPERLRLLVTERSKAAAVSRAASLRARAELGVLLLFLRYHAVTFRGGHGAWGRVLSDMKLNYNTARRSVEAAILWADKSLVAGRGVDGKQAKLTPVCTAAVLAEAAHRAYPAAFSGAAAALDTERATWHAEMVKGRAAARLVNGDKTKAAVVREIASLISELPAWMVAAQAQLQRGGMDAVEAGRLLKAIETIRSAASGSAGVGNDKRVGADVRGARTA